MFGPRITTVFASRWRALWFAGSILLFAYMSVPEADPAPSDQNAQTSAEADRDASSLTREEQEGVQKALAALDQARDK